MKVLGSNEENWELGEFCVCLLFEKETILSNDTFFSLLQCKIEDLLVWDETYGYQQAYSEWCRTI
jgi:hypothetical protein